MLPVALRRSPILPPAVFLLGRQPLRCWASAVGRASSADRPAPPCGSAGLLPGRHHFHSSAARPKKRPPPEAPPRELDLVRYDMKHLWAGPKPALCLGLAGLLPFVGPPLLMAATQTFYPQLASAQVAYGAAVVSFLGGARWGFALPAASPARPDWMNLANATVPPLLAWAAMLMGGVAPAAIMVIVGLGVSLHYDLALLPSYPPWFRALRTVLTLGAFLSLLGTLLMDGVYPDRRLF